MKKVLSFFSYRTVLSNTCYDPNWTCFTWLLTVWNELNFICLTEWHECIVKLWVSVIRIIQFQLGIFQKYRHVTKIWTFQVLYENFSVRGLHLKCPQLVWMVQIAYFIRSKTNKYKSIWSIVKCGSHEYMVYGNSSFYAVPFIYFINPQSVSFEDFTWVTKTAWNEDYLYNFETVCIFYVTVTTFIITCHYIILNIIYN